MIFIAEMARDEGGLIRNTHFRGCGIQGPAILVMWDTSDFAGRVRLLLNRGFESLVTRYPRVTFLYRAQKLNQYKGIALIAAFASEFVAVVYVALAVKIVLDHGAYAPG